MLPVPQFLLLLSLAATILASENATLVEMELYSPVFANNGMIPRQYTAYATNKAVPLRWRNAPSNTASLAIICDDTDGFFTEPWTHWLVFHIPASVDELSEGLPRSLMTNGLRQGVNSFRQANVGYYGPAPPSHYPNSRVVRGTHWYTFTLYALDAVPRVGFAPGRVDLLNAMRGHVLAQTTLVGYYDVL
eukprot:TRINITY_DN3718_c0_g1_i1.p1 TRINITY_DN3718_c0_g1~~TRINITY_DN3718_c0_g1_i1.p1  ORF type:complete len:190 (-),score=16.12 TRINITY_DN3718_c0_g1_i1:333-902(-)